MVVVSVWFVTIVDAVFVSPGFIRLGKRDELSGHWFAQQSLCRIQMTQIRRCEEKFEAQRFIGFIFNNDSYQFAFVDLHAKQVSIAVHVHRFLRLRWHVEQHPDEDQ